MITKSLIIFPLFCSLAYAFSSPSRVFVGTPTQTNPRLVRDCMTPSPIFTFKTTDTVNEAIHHLLRLNLNGAPVVDKDNKLVGVISAFDFLQKENGGAVLPMQGSKEEMGMILNVARKIVATIVGDLMSPDPLTIHPNVSMREAAALMASQRTHRLCVVDDDGQMIGMLATSDVMEDVLDRVHQALPETSTAMKQDTDLLP
jgi:CBS domain-containing protein